MGVERVGGSSWGGWSGGGLEGVTRISGSEPRGAERGAEGFSSLSTGGGGHVLGWKGAGNAGKERGKDGERKLTYVDETLLLVAIASG